MDALILWLWLLKVRITAMARTHGFPFVFLSAFFICVLQGAGGAIFEIQNNCRFTVWAAGSSSGGKRLDSGQSWRVQVANGTSTGGRFWGRTGCSFNGNGRGSCNTGDCAGLLNCQGSGNPPATMVEYSLNQHQNSVFYDISLVDGFNLPMSIIPSNSSCNAVTCTSNISAICPAELRVSGGCDSACTRFNTSQYCCTDKYSNNCGPTNYSMVFKHQCPEAYSYAMDDTISISTCPGSTDYKVVFCGGNATSLQDKVAIASHRMAYSMVGILFRTNTVLGEDKGYLKWRWQPMSCDILRFNAPGILRRLQGLRVMFVGDSMARTYWESLSQNIMGVSYLPSNARCS